MRLTGVFLLLILAGACSHRPDNPLFVFPAGPYDSVPQPDYNPATEKGVALGKKLFFDPILSADGKVSCATCHLPSLAFTDGQALTRRGVSGEPLLRHAPALFNLAWYDGFFWDGGSKNLESQVFGPLIHPDEMGVDLKQLMEKLNRHPEYPTLFAEVWGTDTINSQRLARTMAQYERTLLSFSSPYDKWKAGEYELPEQALRGYDVYRSHCSGCHPEPWFTDFGYHNNAIDTAFTNTTHELTYFGRYRITNDSVDIGRYKTPSLRNLGFTAPYMHDGRFADMDAVFKHYFRDHTANTGADSLLKQGSYAMTGEAEREALYVFLMQLNDTAFTRNP